MNIRTMKKLEKIGYDKDWLTVVKSEFKPKKNGYYKIEITDIENIGDNPKYGEFIEVTTFCNDFDLSEILRYFEGFAYVMTDMTTMKSMGSGIIDYNLFDFMEDYTGCKWDLFSNEELDAEKKVKQERKENMIEALTREVCELRAENAKLRLELKRCGNEKDF